MIRQDSHPAPWDVPRAQCLHLTGRTRFPTIVQTHVEAGNGLSMMEMDGVNIFELDWIIWTQNGEDAENNLQDRLRSDLMAQMAYDFKHHWTQHQASTGFHQVSGLLSSPFCFFGAGSSFQGEKSRNPLVNLVNLVRSNGGHGIHHEVFNIRVFASVWTVWTLEIAKSSPNREAFKWYETLWNTRSLSICVSLSPAVLFVIFFFIWFHGSIFPIILKSGCSKHDDNLQISGHE